MAEGGVSFEGESIGKLIQITDEMVIEGVRQLSLDRSLENDWEFVARMYAAMRGLEWKKNVLSPSMSNRQAVK